MAETVNTRSVSGHNGYDVRPVLRHDFTSRKAHRETQAAEIFALPGNQWSGGGALPRENAQRNVDADRSSP